MPDPTPLHRRLCQYYLACIARDDAGGVSVPARQGAEPAYVELARLELDAARLAGDDKLLEFARGRHRRESGTMRLGYPIFAPRLKWEGAPRKLVPLFLVDVAADEKGLEPEWHTCALNLEALRELEGNEIHFAQHSMLELEEGLGLAALDTPKPFAQILERLKLLRPEWPWTAGQAGVKSLREANAGFIYERGIVLRVLRPYTQGLELELQRLAQLPEDALRGTALGALLFGPSEASSSLGEGPPLIEVLPMNAEQRTAVRMGLREPLTTITGPPGTGKSQVVANLLINCAWQRQRTLFSSKNHKAVDVVHDRVNGLGEKPIVVRLGAKEHRRKLAEHLTYLAEGTVRAEVVEELRTEQLAYERLTRALTELDEAERSALVQEARLAETRRALSAARLDISGASRERARAVDRAALLALLFNARDALLHALRDRDADWQRLLRRLLRRTRYGALEETLQRLASALRTTAPARPAETFRPEDAGAWKDYLVGVAREIERIKEIAEYDESLRGLRELDVGAWAARRVALKKSLVETSGRLWQAWVASQPVQLSLAERATLKSDGDILKRILEADAGAELPAEVRRDYDRLTLKAPAVVSCFALTTLSARNRVPFTAGYFDLVVFDESSQCDLASALPLLYRAKRAVVIGDPKQLRHISGLRRDRDVAFLTEQRLRASHGGWQYSTQSLFDLTQARVGAAGSVSLREHHRSHPDVVAFPNRAFYGDALRVLTQLPTLKRSTDGPAVEWLDVKGSATRGQQGSVFNAEEVRAVVEEVKRLLEAGYCGTLGVVTPFAHQADRIRRELERDRALFERLRRDHDFQSATAHGFQGDERDLMIFSIVAAPGLHAGAQRFLEDETHVFNVAITRARAELRVVGHLSWCLSSPVKHLAEFASFVASLRSREETANGGARGSVARASTLHFEAERLRRALEEAGIAPEATPRIEQYEVDLALHCGEAHLAIDVPPAREDPAAASEALEREQLKRERLLALGWEVLRFAPVQIQDDLPWCVKRVQTWVEAQEHRAGSSGATDVEIDAHAAALGFVS